MAKYLFIMVLAILLLSCSAENNSTQKQDPLNVCASLLQTQGTKKAFPACYKEASLGHAPAQYEIARLYEEGADGVKKNEQSANAWYHHAADQNYIPALLKLASQYAKGQGVEKSDSKAFTWYEKAALLGDKSAQTAIGLCYLEGKGIVRSPERSKVWLTKSAQAGDNQARFQLSKLLLEGAPVKSEQFEAALKYLHLAANEKHVPSELMLADIYRTKLDKKPQAMALYDSAITTQDPSAQYHVAMLIKDQQISSHYSMLTLIQQAAHQGFIPAELTLAKMYEEGDSVQNNPQLAFQWYLSAAKKDDPEGAYQVGISYIFGNFNQEKNPQEGMKWLKIAANKSCFPAQYILASLYLEGYPVLENSFLAVRYLSHPAKEGSTDAQIKLAKVLIQFNVPQFDRSAFYWLSKVEDNPEAKFLLGELYRNGIGVEVNFKKAAEIFQELADNDHALAQCRLAGLYYFGQGVEKNHGKAKFYLLASAEQGTEEAKTWLAIFFKEGAESEGESNDQMLHFKVQLKEAAALYHKGLDLLHKSEKTDFDLSEGLNDLKESASRDYIPALRELGSICEKSLFGCNDMAVACDWYKQGALLGDVYCQFHLAEIYYLGIGLEKDYITSYAYASLAANQNHKEALLLKEDILSVLSDSERASAEALYQQLEESVKQ